MEFRATELDFTARKIQECHDKLNVSIRRMNDLIPSLQDTLAQVAGLGRRFRKSRRKARFWRFSAEALVWLPTLIADLRFDTSPNA